LPGIGQEVPDLVALVSHEEAITQSEYVQSRG
jgi:hypothetical protein